MILFFIFSWLKLGTGSTILHTYYKCIFFYNAFESQYIKKKKKKKGKKSGTFLMYNNNKKLLPSQRKPLRAKVALWQIIQPSVISMQIYEGIYHSNWSYLSISEWKICLKHGHRLGQNIIEFACCSVVQCLWVHVGSWLDSELFCETTFPGHVYDSHPVTAGIRLQ